MAFFLKTSEITVIDEDTAEGVNEAFAEALRTQRDVAVSSLQKFVPSVTDDQVTLSADGKIIINNAEFVAEVSKPTLMGADWIKNAGCGGGC